MKLDNCNRYSCLPKRAERVNEVIELFRLSACANTRSTNESQKFTAELDWDCVARLKLSCRDLHQLFNLEL